MERPLLRCASAKCSSGGLGFSRGEEFEPREWPDPRFGEVEGANPAGERLLGYYKAHHLSAGFPPKPNDGEHPFYLPANPSSTQNRSPPAETQPTENMPRYELIGDIRLGGQQHHTSGPTIVFLGWPSQVMRPVNPPAAAVTKYYSPNSENPRLLKAPWCCCRDALFLPPLSAGDELPVRHSERDLSPKKPPVVRRKPGARPRVRAA